MQRRHTLPLLLTAVLALGVLGWTLSSMGYDPETAALQRIRELQREREILRDENGRLRKERDELRKERDELRKERDELRKERDELRKERDELQKERDELQERWQKCEEKQKAAQDETIKKLSDENKGLYSQMEELQGNLRYCKEAQKSHSRELWECKENNENILSRCNPDLNLARYNRESKSCGILECNIWWLILCFVSGFFLAWCCRSCDEESSGKPASNSMYVSSYLEIVKDSDSDSEVSWQTSIQNSETVAVSDAHGVDKVEFAMICRQIPELAY